MKLREQFDKLVQERNIQAAALSPIWFQYPAVVKIRRFLFVSKVWSYVTLLLIVYSLLINLITVTFVNATYKPVISALDILVLSIFLVEWVLKCVVTPVKDYLLSLESFFDLLAFAVPLFSFIVESLSDNTSAVSDVNVAHLKAVTMMLSKTARAMRILRFSALGSKTHDIIEKTAEKSILSKKLLQVTNMKVLLGVLIMLVGRIFLQFPDSFTSTPDLGFDMLLQMAESIKAENHTNLANDTRLQAAVDAYLFSMRATVGHKAQPLWSQQTILLLNIAGVEHVNAIEMLPELMPHRHNIALDYPHNLRWRSFPFELVCLRSFQFGHNDAGNRASVAQRCDILPEHDNEQFSTLHVLQYRGVIAHNVADLCVNVMTILVVLLLGWGIDRDYDKYVVSQVTSMIQTLQKLAEDPREALKILSQTAQEFKQRNRSQESVLSLRNRSPASSVVLPQSLVSRRHEVLSDVEYSENNEIAIIRRMIGMYGMLVRSALGEAGNCDHVSTNRLLQSQLWTQINPVNRHYFGTRNTGSCNRVCMHPGMGIIASNFARLPFERASPREKLTVAPQSRLSSAVQSDGGRQNILVNDEDVDYLSQYSKKVVALFGFCSIARFDAICDALQEHTLTFTNHTAAIVHNCVDTSGGQVNKNLGNCFLCVWKSKNVSGSTQVVHHLRSETATRKEFGSEGLVDQAVRAMARSHIALGQYDQANEHIKEAFVARLPGYQLRMSFGLHFGWAIEGAIGSKFKIDASYLSPNVNIASRVDLLTRFYDVPLLLSDACFARLSTQMKENCRPIDCVTVKGSAVPIRLYTLYSWCYSQLEDPIMGPTTLDQEEFACHWKKAYEAYIAGNWPTAGAALRICHGLQPLDGPTSSLIQFLKTHGDDGNAPASWSGVRSYVKKK